jgi:histidine triad (HIT) family protein
MSEKGCVFCDIIARKTTSAVILDEPRVYAFLDHRPLLPGHVLVVPRTHYETLGDLPPDEVGPFFQAVRRLALAVERAFHADGSFVAANIKVSQSVPHLHVHVVPRRKGDGLFGRNFVWIRRPYPSSEAMAEAQQAIRAELQTTA